MTVQEAKDMMQAKLTCLELDSDIEGCDGDCEGCKYYYKQGTFGEQKEAIKLAIEALKKQIPKKVKSPIRRGAYSDCPICGIEVEMPWCYCYKCGQRLDWGLVNERFD